jgi:Protein of unknown function (DUF3060)
MNVGMKQFIGLLLLLGSTAVRADELPTSTVLDCSKTKSVSITTGSGSYRIIGTCDKVSISGGKNALQIEAVKNLSITGSKNSIVVVKADKIAALGSGNSVTYASGLTVATPKIASLGKGNTIVKVDVTMPANDAAAPTAAAAGTALDCTDSPTQSIVENDGTYTVSGACEQIAVTGNNNKLTVASAVVIAIAGNANTVAAAAVDKISVSGNKNTVSWKKGVAGAKAKVSNVGTGNKIKQTK